jgi:hypothetical protein
MRPKTIPSLRERDMPKRTQDSYNFFDVDSRRLWRDRLTLSDGKQAWRPAQAMARRRDEIRERH